VEQFGDLADYFDDCRRRQNRADYVGVGYVFDTEADICWQRPGSLRRLPGVGFKIGTRN